jgi:hypothetical protein
MTMHHSHCRRQSLVCWITITLIFLQVVGIQGLVPLSRTSRYCAQQRHVLGPATNHRFSRFVSNSAKGQRDDSAKVQVANYNDDAFGLVFLCGAFVAQDIVFSATFLLGSGVAALLTKQGQISFSNQIPPVVAVCSLVLASICSTFLQDISWIPLKSESALQVESIICFLSVLYGFVLSPWIAKQR